MTDSTGAAIPGATITVTDLATNRAVSVQSQPDGSYVVGALPIGNYKVDAIKQAFKAESVTLSLQISEVKELSFKLQVGSGTETVRSHECKRRSSIPRAPRLEKSSKDARLSIFPSTAATSPRWLC